MFRLFKYLYQNTRRFSTFAVREGPLLAAVVFLSRPWLRGLAQMAELVDAPDSKSGFPKESAGSIPVLGTGFQTFKGSFRRAFFVFVPTMSEQV
jgi:hypothetical protein